MGGIGTKIEDAAQVGLAPVTGGASLAVPGGSSLSAPGKSGGAPSAPDFAAAATPNQTNAYGSSSQWGRDPRTGQMTQNQSFGGPLAGAATNLEGQVANAWGSPLSNGADARTAASDAVYNQETSRLDPQWQQQQQQFQSQMAAQGLAPGTEAYDNAFSNFSRAKNDAYSSAQNQSITMGGNAAQQQQQMDLASRFAPEQALAGMGSMAGQSQNPLLPAAIAQYQGALQGYGIQQAGKNSQMGGLASLGGAAMMAGG